MRDTRCGWLLAIYRAIGLVEGDAIIVYYNAEDPRWTASAFIHESIHLALGLTHGDTLSALAEEALAHTASFKSGFHSLYLKSVKEAVKLPSCCCNTYGEYELANLVAPRLLAHRLVVHGYEALVGSVEGSPKAILRLWLEAHSLSLEGHSL